MAFDQVPFSVAMSEISSVTGLSIVWSQEADKTYISGTFDEVNVNALLLAIGKRYGLAVTDLDGVIFMGTPSQSDCCSVVVRCPFVDKTLTRTFESCLSESGSVVQMGTCYIISDYVYNVKKVLEVVEAIREKMGRSYIAELYFVRMKSTQLLDIQAKLSAQNVDIFSCTLNLETLFKMVLNVEASKGLQTIANTPRLYLSEGRTARLTVGSQLVRSRSSVSSEGYSTVSGYDTFNDGIEICLTPSRVDSDLIALDVNLSVSKFNSDSVSDVPANDKSEIVSPGVLVTDGGIYFLGSLQMTEKKKSGIILGVNDYQADEIVTVWVKIRELFLEKI